jgi:hypothetical protein
MRDTSYKKFGNLCTILTGLPPPPLLIMVTREIEMFYRKQLRLVYMKYKMRQISVKLGENTIKLDIENVVCEGAN